MDQWTMASTSRSNTGTLCTQAAKPHTAPMLPTGASEEASPSLMQRRSARYPSSQG